MKIIFTIMIETSFNPKTAYKTIKIMFMALIIGPLLFLLTTLYIAESMSFIKFDLAEPLNMALIVLALILTPVGGMISRKIFAKVTPESNLEDRLKLFQAGFIVRLATYEAIELFSIVVFLLTGNLLVLLFALIALFGIVSNYPSPTRIRQAVGIIETDLI